MLQDLLRCRQRARVGLVLKLALLRRAVIWSRAVLQALLRLPELTSPCQVEAVLLFCHSQQMLHPELLVLLPGSCCSVLLAPLELVFLGSR